MQPFFYLPFFWLPPSDLHNDKHRTVHALEAWTFSRLFSLCECFGGIRRKRTRAKSSDMICYVCSIPSLKERKRRIDVSRLSLGCLLSVVIAAARAALIVCVPVFVVSVSYIFSFSYTHVSCHNLNIKWCGNGYVFPRFKRMWGQIITRYMASIAYYRPSAIIHATKIIIFFALSIEKAVF